MDINSSFIIGNEVYDTRFLAVNTPKVSHRTYGAEPWGRAVKEFIKFAIPFFSREQIINTVLETFESGSYAVCAIVQTSSNKPDMYEIEKAFLMLDGENWRLLPQPQDHRSSLNNLAPEDLAAFDPLEKQFLEFKARDKELRAPNKEQ